MLCDSQLNKSEVSVIKLMGHPVVPLPIYFPNSIFHRVIRPSVPAINHLWGLDTCEIEESVSPHLIAAAQWALFLTPGEVGDLRLDMKKRLRSQILT